jgi:hypothetical protein
MKKRVADNEVFVKLIQVAEEDEAVRRKLAEILSLPPTHRRSVLNFYIDQMRQNGAPEAFISAVACLLDNGVADRALSLLGKKEDDSAGD